MAIYMKFGSATGDVTEAGHTGQIELLEARWGMSRLIRSGGMESIRLPNSPE
jgi:hypothetical protein